MAAITVYTKPACVQCAATLKALDRQGIEYQKIDVTQNSKAREYVMSLGYLGAPVVYVSPRSTGPVSVRIASLACSPPRPADLERTAHPMHTDAGLKEPA
ncbi:hypothetical protein MMRN_p0700 (plasmid) [Mycobacterium marinum]|nr:hypothetical protein MMRN_p0700 [Mycobacterium marinum]